MQLLIVKKLFKNKYHQNQSDNNDNYDNNLRKFLPNLYYDIFKLNKSS